MNCSKERKVLLIFDLHKTHTKSLELIDYTIDNGVALISLPPHTSHKFQSLDRSILEPLKTHFNNECTKWMQNHPGRRITVDQLGSLFSAACLKYVTLANAVSGFKTSGIFPFNPEIIPEN